MQSGPDSDLDLPPRPGDFALRQEVAECEHRLGLTTIVEAGQVIGAGQGYRLIEQIGAGGMGTVYRAHDLGLDKDVAVKVIKRAVLGDRLVREAQALASLEHPNVVPVYHVGETDEGDPFIVMKYVPGLDLRKWVRTHKPDLAKLLELFIAAGRGLEAVHDAGFIHRDFKPDNVLVCEVGGREQVFVGDFGLAKELSPSEAEPVTLPDAHASAARGSTTEVGTRRAGTPVYLAPERIAGEPAKQASDQYAFCVSLWEMCGGGKPTTDRTFACPEDMPPWLCDVLTRGLDVEPSRRFPNMGSLITALEAGPAVSRSRSRRRWAAGIALALALGAGSVGATVSRSDTDTSPSSTCDDAGAVEQLWSADDRAALAEHLRAIAPAATADALVDTTLATLDDAAQRWATDRRAACERSWLRGDVDEPCEQLWALRFQRQVELLTRVEADQLFRVPELLWSLSQPGCSERGPSLDFDVAKHLDRARDEVALGQFKAAETTARAALSLAESIASCGPGWGYERAAVHYALGYIHAKWGNPDKALTELEAAEAQAEACPDRDLRRKVRLRAAKVYAVGLGDPVKASKQLELARAGANLAAVEPEDAFEARAVEAAIASLVGDYERAATLYAAALERIDGRDPLRAAEARLNLGVMALAMGDAELAEVHWERALSELEAAFGPLAADYAAEQRALIAANQGELAFARDELDDARTFYEQAAKSSRQNTRLAGFNGQLRVGLKLAGNGDFASGLALADRLAAQLGPSTDLPRERLATHLLLRGRLRLLAYYDDAFRAGPEAERERQLDAGFADLERALELWKDLPEDTPRYDCMVFLAWHLSDIRGEHGLARSLLDQALAKLDEGDDFYQTAHDLDANLKKIEG